MSVRTRAQRLSLVIALVVGIPVLLGAFASAVFGAEWFGVTFYGWEALWRYALVMILVLAVAVVFVWILVAAFVWAEKGESS